MSIEKTEALVVGGGQAGIAASEHLSKCGIPHLVLERSRIAERWRSERWDSLVANGPAWHDRFPGLEFEGADPDSFPPKEEVADYFEAYAKMIDAPVRTGVEVTKVRKLSDRLGFHVETSEGEIEATYLIAATGPFQKPIIPPIVPEVAGFHQLHSNHYRNPEQLPEGGVLVVGAGSSGTQIADELMRSGRKVALSVGPHGRYPRRYRGRDYCWWLGVLGRWDTETPEPNTEHVTIAVSGAYGGRTIDFRELAERGMILVGSAERYADEQMHFKPDLQDNLAMGDDAYLTVLRQADAYVERNGLSLPDEAEAHIIPGEPDCVKNPLQSMELKEEGITTILWATGYAKDYGWLQVEAFDDNGRPDHKRGVSREPGVYFLGLPWLSRRGSSFIWGVWQDARYIADHINTHRGYMDYNSYVAEKSAEK